MNKSIILFQSTNSSIKISMIAVFSMNFLFYIAHLSKIEISTYILCVYYIRQKIWIYFASIGINKRKVSNEHTRNIFERLHIQENELKGAVNESILAKLS